MQDVKTFLRIAEAVRKIDELRKAVDALVTDAPPGLNNFRDDLEKLGLHITELGNRVITEAMGEGVRGPVDGVERAGEAHRFFDAGSEPDRPSELPITL